MDLLGRFMDHFCLGTTMSSVWQSISIFSFASSPVNSSFTKERKIQLRLIDFRWQFSFPCFKNLSENLFFQIDIYFPVMPMLQFFFYMSWLKIAEVMMNPYGEVRSTNGLFYTLGLSGWWWLGDKRADRQKYQCKLELVIVINSYLLDGNGDCWCWFR